MDALHRALKVIDYNRYTVLAVGLVLTTAVWLGACASKTQGLTDDAPVDRAGLERQVIELERGLAAERATIEASLDAFNAKVEAHNGSVAVAVADLDRQDAVKAQIVSAIGGQAIKLASGGIDPASLVTTIVTVGSMSLVPALVLDKRRADQRIAAMKGTP